MSIVECNTSRTRGSRRAKERLDIVYTASGLARVKVNTRNILPSTAEMERTGHAYHRKLTTKESATAKGTDSLLQEGLDSKKVQTLSTTERT